MRADRPCGTLSGRNLGRGEVMDCHGTGGDDDGRVSAGRDDRVISDEPASAATSLVIAG
jgi:hypothetical protein